MPHTHSDSIETHSLRPESLKLFLLLLTLFTLLTSTAATAHAATINVPAGGDFQAALNSAQPGDTITLAAGASYVGPFTLPYKPGGSAARITVRTSAPDSSLPPAGQRITPAYASALPKVLSPGFNEPALRTAPGAHHYTFLGVEFAPVSATAVIDTLIILGDTGTNQDTYDEVPHHLRFDRCYIHALPTMPLKRGIALQSAHTDILNSYVAGFKVVGQEAQAICGWNGPGPFRIFNNYVEGAGENLMFGGATPTLPNLIPSDIEVRRNHFYKPPSWREGDPSYAGTHWSVKNLFELKNARRVIVEGNVFENNWVDAQSGFSILFTARPNDSGPAAVVQDVLFTNNVVKNVAQGVSFLGIDDIYCAPERPDCGGQRLHRVNVTHNLFLNVGAFGGRGRWVQVLNGANQVTLDHNTAFHTESGLTADGAPSTGLVFRNNLFRRNNPDGMGVFGSGNAEGVPTLNHYFPSAVFQKNLIYGVEQVIGSQEKPCWHSLQNGCYPADNFYPPDSVYGGTFEGLFMNYAAVDYRLAAASPYRGAGTDFRDVGVDTDMLALAMAGAVSGVWTPNSIDNSRYFVRQHYVDFLGREPDGLGLNFWTGEIESCGADAACREVKRVNVSAAFFLSIEFQETGYLAYRAWGVAFGPTRVDGQRALTREEFLPDAGALNQNLVVGASGWEAQLEANKTAYFNAFVARTAFTALYPTSMTPTQYVDALNASAGFVLSQTERNQLVADLTNGVKTRAQVLRAVAEDADFAAAQKNRAFVTMEYLGYLRRDPDPGGFDFWLGKLNQFGGDFIAAEMVKGFITSAEYRSRFGQL